MSNNSSSAIHPYDAAMARIARIAGETTSPPSGNQSMDATPRPDLYDANLVRLNDRIDGYDQKTSPPSTSDDVSNSSLGVTDAQELIDLGTSEAFRDTPVSLDTRQSTLSLPFSNLISRYFIPKQFGHFVLCKVLCRNENERARSRALRYFYGMLWNLFTLINSDNHEFMTIMAELGITLDETLIGDGIDLVANGENISEGNQRKAMGLYDAVAQKRDWFIMSATQDFDGMFGPGMFEMEVLRFERICPYHRDPIGVRR